MQGVKLDDMNYKPCALSKDGSCVNTTVWIKIQPHDILNIAQPDLVQWS